MNVKLMMVVLATSCMTYAQAGNNWLAPTDEQIEKAIDLGFQAAKVRYHEYSFNPQKSKTGTDYVRQPSIVVVTPYSALTALA